MELATTVVNLFELFLGAFKYREAKTSLTGVKGLCSTLRILSFTEEASLLVAKILSGLEKAGRGIEIRDLPVGGRVLQEGYAVATENKEHFERILPELDPASKELGRCYRHFCLGGGTKLRGLVNPFDPLELG